ncbi:GNAT family N-acetyltransferase [Pseudobutyrivibrio xylanivorans]|uniref:Uncharacterized protein n=1 Tax=Pseudobutyrivibrio xylanivorans DSM 14809 TaxID=1123012 RepID=A0A1M6APK3_PSEXY|nr:hypothetical protein [Pseudobutyrivibrio xylanivorans]SHI38327.1 hypothetical protein SAMN02745725_00313 [Pseudobutyrivibrio xylanivorans DSM 14809]
MRIETDKNIGYVQLVPIGEDKLEIGYHVAKPFTRNGYATTYQKHIGIGSRKNWIFYYLKSFSS